MVVVVFELLGKLFEVAVELLAITDGVVCKSVVVEFVAVLVGDRLAALPPSAMAGGSLGGRLPCCGGTLFDRLPAGWPCTLDELRKRDVKLGMAEQTPLQINTRKFN